MEEGIFPHSRSATDPEQMEEERRLAYVGVTRAKDRLYLVRAFRRSSYGFDEPTAPSRFLADISPELLDNYNQRRRTGSPVTTRQAAQQLSSRWDQGSRVSTTTSKAAAYKVGDRVRHGKFGDGTVIGVELEGGEEFVQVAFPSQGIKKLSTSFAPLEKRS
jgi:DNA helicase-2/ATP-dependent DNA helicase PcrA